MSVNHLAASEDRDRRISQSLGFAVGVCLAVGVSFGLVLGASAGPQEGFDRLEARINPNTACVASLVRLPGVGLTRARAIVVFRERFGRETGDTVAFRSPNDLQRIRGIGPKTVEGMAGWLKFE